LVVASHDFWDFAVNRPQYTPTASKVIRGYRDLPPNQFEPIFQQQLVG
jgi:hypothetical protein